MNMNLLRMLALLLLFAGTGAYAQDDQHGKFASVDIRSNAVCDMCVTTIETEMLYVKGVQQVRVDMEANLIHVDYRPNRTDPDKLRKAISDLGYMADDVPPDPEARKALPDCCQDEGCGLPAEKHPGAPGVPVHPPAHAE